MKENQMMMQIATLEKEKGALKSQLSDLISDITQVSLVLYCSNWRPEIFYIVKSQIEFYFVLNFISFFQKSSSLESLQFVSERSNEEIISLRQTYSLYKAKVS